jgi:hypothetical protein
MTVIEWVGKSPSGSAGEFWSRSESEMSVGTGDRAGCAES